MGDSAADHADSCAFCPDGGVGGGGRIPVMFKSSALDGGREETERREERENREKREKREKAGEKKNSGGGAHFACGGGGGGATVMSDGAVEELFGLASGLASASV